jgi:hypothetical protein
VAPDECKLGSSESVQAIVSEAEKSDKERSRLSLKVSDLFAFARIPRSLLQGAVFSLAKQIAEGEGLASIFLDLPEVLPHFERPFLCCCKCLSQLRAP